MENCLLNYFIVNNELKSTCDFDPFLLKQQNGIYELLRVTGGKPLFLEDHIGRFFQSIHLAGLPSVFSAPQLKNRLKTLIESNKLKNGNIRFQYAVHPQSGPVFLARVVPAFYPAENNFQKGVKVVSLQAERENPNAKRDNLPVREQANKLIRSKNVFEVLLIDKNGFVTEASRCNVFFIDREKLLTPPLSVVLPGVTRSKIIRLAKTNGIAVVEQPVKFAEVDDFDAVFLSGTSIKVLPVSRVDGLAFPSANPLVSKIGALYDELLNDYLRGFSW